MLINIELCARFNKKLFLTLFAKLIEVRTAHNPADSPENIQLRELTISYIFYALRLLYSIPSKRHFFKKVFPPRLFGQFVDVLKIPSSFHIFQSMASEFLSFSVS